VGLVVFGCRLLIASVFAVAGVAKLADRAGSEQSLIEFGVPTSLGRPLSWLLPLIEIVGAVALLRTPWSHAGAVIALALLLLFSGAISF
jgi:uncharacterized membrane protein YphA (DoxX/SURF4 family)